MLFLDADQEYICIHTRIYLLLPLNMNFLLEESQFNFLAFL